MPTDLAVTLPDGSTVGYAEVGDPRGAPVVHLHGTPGSRLEVTSPGIEEAARGLGVRLLAPDRPGTGRSTFRRFPLADYPWLLREFVDAVGLERFAVMAVSGGGKYAFACAWRIPDRVTRVVVVSSTCSFDTPEARATWSKEDRGAYTLAGRAPWLFWMYFAKLRRDLRNDPNALFSMFPELGPSDKAVLEREDMQQLLRRDMAEAFRQGARGPAHDYTREARAWCVPLDEIVLPVDIWHGDDDRLVSPEQSRILAQSLPSASRHLVPGEGHLLLFTDHATDILQSALASGAAPGDASTRAAAESRRCTDSTRQHHLDRPT